MVRRRPRFAVFATLVLASCRGPELIGYSGDADGSSEDAGSASNTGDSATNESETGDDDGLQEFEPGVCGSWNPPPAAPAGDLPPEQDCADVGMCPVFTEVAAAAGLGTVQFVPTHPAESNCIFAWPTDSGLTPGQDCEPQWFTAGVTVGDVDRDDWPDVYLTRLAAPDHLFRNLGDGTFVDIAAEVGLGECSWTNGASFGDIDDDGDLDLLVTTVGDYAHQMWINQLSETGELRFEEQASARGFDFTSTWMHSGESVTFGDYDRDGWLDVHVNEWIRAEHMPTFGDPAMALHGGRLLHNLGSGIFEDVTAAAGVEVSMLDEDGMFPFSSTFVDLDGDGWQDLALAIDFHRSRLFWNNGDGSFMDGTAEANVNRESNAMGSTFADVDRDGDLDWFVTSIAEADECEEDETPPCWSGSGNRLYSYAGERTFTLATDTAGVRDGAWAWGTTFFDADNDGDQDLALGNGWPGRDLHGGFYHADTPTRLWINDGTGVMSEEGEARGVFDKGQNRGMLSFDYDRDGDLDLLLSNHAGSPKLFRNDGGNRNAWLRVEVQGTVSNRDGRGAKLRVQVEPDGPWQVREVGVGSHFLGESELIQHFGLGPEFEIGVDTVHRVEVEFPVSGAIKGYDAVADGQTLLVLEAE
jgi:hypothetical protein